MKLAGAVYYYQSAPWTNHKLFPTNLTLHKSDFTRTSEYSYHLQKVSRGFRDRPRPTQRFSTVEFENSLPPGHTGFLSQRRTQIALDRTRTEKSPLFFLDVLLVNDQNYHNYRLLHQIDHVLKRGVQVSRSYTE